MQTSFAKSKIKILLTEGIHQSAIEAFAAYGYDNITQLAHAPGEAELLDLVSEYHIIGIRSRTQMNAAVMARADRLIALGCFCIGTNQVDLGAAAARAVPVFNAPYSNTRSVAELVIAEAILLLRGVPEKSRQMHQGVWRKTAASAFEIRGKTLGIIGYGNIGGQLSVLAESLGMNVVFYDTVKKLKLGNARQLDSLDAVARAADVISLHVPADASTTNMINAGFIRCMKSTAVLINASRGKVVDIDALTYALSSGQIQGAAIDVFPEEPKSNADPFESPLIGLPNTILTPHIGGSTVEAQENIGVEVAEKLARFSDNGSTQTAVNFPEAALPDHPGAHRLLHIHRNIPGVMTALNQALSEHGINISAQYLMTRDDLGYVVTDIDREYSSEIQDALRAVEGTLKLRVLF